MNITGFLRWQFGKFYQDLSFWGFMTCVVAFVAAYLGCPKPIPFWMTMTGLAVVVFDATRTWFRFSYQLYRMEQERIMRELKKEEQK